MSLFTTCLNTEKQRVQNRIAEGAAYFLAIAIHLILWRIYQAMPEQQTPPENPQTIEIALVTAGLQPAQIPAPAQTAAVPAQPQPEARPQPPKPKPVPRPENPVVKKVVKPKAKPVPETVPKPRAESEKESEPAPVAASESISAPAHAPAPAASPTPKAAPKPEGGSAESTRFSQGTVSGYRTAYPAVARERGWEGTATVKIRVSAEGEIEDVTLVSSSGHNVLDDYAVEAVKSARHVRPCHRGDKPVDCTFTQPFQFKLTRE